MGQPGSVPPKPSMSRGTHRPRIPKNPFDRDRVQVTCAHALLLQNQGLKQRMELAKAALRRITWSIHPLARYRPHRTPLPTL